MTDTIKNALLGAFALGLVGSLVSLAFAHEVPAQEPGEPVSDVVFPEQHIPLNFSHVLHMSKADLACDDCHENAPDSQSSLDNLIPTEKACSGCHLIDRSQPDKQVEAGEPPARCDACHVGFDAKTGYVDRVVVPKPNIKFNHKKHVADGVSCQTCHGDLEATGVALATREQLPKMSTCLTCHDGGEAPDECTTCHLAEAGGFVKTDYDQGKLAPSGALRGDDHDMSFRMSHKFAAQNDDAYCASCHRKEFCIDCHNGVTKPMDFHANDYITIHPIEARRNNPDCSSCHRLQTFCVGCHARSGLVNETLGAEAGADRGGAYPLGRSGNSPLFHPAGWVEFDDRNRTRSPDNHAYQAQRNIKQCASCHRESFCTNCHTRQPSLTGGLTNINPHPRNWLGSRRCKALAKRAGRMCLRCHIDASEVDCERSL